ncbi:hypothetical protein NQ318_004377 [Aromia moschata]|uniref:ZAD domain-containing protein n=1 Tax=Aromia moschata TaxID=1265417 RepID=A0AAV8YTT1_9CUCU|nr:hypothetical protein NQ318_004377 [Aromia moschata]
MEASEKMEQPCRLCDGSGEKMLSVFDKTEEGQQILHLIKECLPIIIYRTDPLSKQICEKCFNNLELVSRFKKSSQYTAEKHKENLRANWR